MLSVLFVRLIVKWNAYSGSISRSTDEVESTHKGHPHETHPSLLCFPAVDQQPMYDENDCREAESGIHRSPVRSQVRSTETWVQSSVYACSS